MTTVLLCVLGIFAFCVIAFMCAEGRIDIFCIEDKDKQDNESGEI